MSLSLGLSLSLKTVGSAAGAPPAAAEAAAYYLPTNSTTMVDQNGNLADAVATDCSFVASGGSYTDDNSTSRTASHDLLFTGATGYVSTPWIPQLNTGENASALLVTRLFAVDSAGRLIDVHDGGAGPGFRMGFSGTSTTVITTIATGSANTTEATLTAPLNTYFGAGIVVSNDVTGWVNGSEASIARPAGDLTPVNDLRVASAASVATAKQSLEVVALFLFDDERTTDELEALTDWVLA